MTNKLKVVQPRVGDEWEFKLPGKSKRRKIVGGIGEKYGKLVDGTMGLYHYIDWERLPKGRYSGLSVYLLQKHGRRISTKAERGAHLDMLIARAQGKRDAAKRGRR